MPYFDYNQGYFFSYKFLPGVGIANNLRGFYFHQPAPLITMRFHEFLIPFFWRQISKLRTFLPVIGIAKHLRGFNFPQPLVAKGY